MRVTWSPRARSHLIALRAYIAERNPWAAARIGQHIEAAVAQLADFPLMGRSGRIEGTRELVISRTPYVAAYIVAADEVTVLAVMHGAQRWPESL